MRLEASPRANAISARTSRPRFQIAVAFSSFILIGANDAALGILLPSIRAHYGIPAGTAGLLFPASTLGYLTAAFSSGLLLEWLGRRTFFLLGAASFGLGALLVFTTPPFSLLLPSLLLVGFGEAILDAGFNAYIAGLPRNAGLLNYLHAFYGGGALLGPLLASAILALGWSWNATYLVWACAGALAVATYLFAFERRDARPATSTSESEGSDSGNLMVLTLRSRLVWTCAIFLLVYVGIEVSMGSWSYSLLTAARHLPPLPASWMVSGYWLGLTLGRLALGHVANRIGSRRLILGCLGGVLAGVLLVWVAPVGAVAAAGLWLTGFSLGPIFPTTIAVISGIVAPRLQQSAIGFAASLGSMGSALFPWLAGNLIQRLGLWSLLPYLCALTVAMFAVWLLLQRLASASAHQPASPSTPSQKPMSGSDRL